MQRFQSPGRDLHHDDPTSCISSATHFFLFKVMISYTYIIIDASRNKQPSQDTFSAAEIEIKCMHTQFTHTFHL